MKVADLLEAEGRSLRTNAARLAGVVAVALAAAVVAVFGIVVLITSLFLALVEPVGPPGAAALCGALLLACAGGLVWMFQKLAR